MNIELQNSPVSGSGFRSRGGDLKPVSASFSIVL